MRLEDITNAVLEQLRDTCAECAITSDIIDRESFMCYPESPTYVTYRARLEGTSETDSGSLISLIEKWVFSSEASIIVTGVLMTVDSECSVAISSLSEGECSPTQPPTPDRIPETQTPTMDNTTASEDLSSAKNNTASDNIAAIIGVIAVVIVLIIAIMITVIVIVVVVMKDRHGGLSNANNEK